ncbi:DOMON domain-containing protein [Desulfoluna sp.]|uniref:DOMON domain-containing protein n=1 Tax=Desulfoluna sp. TaxID=2045199 RepID=UPI00260CCF74|nr:DOMON domain-containing protein [Desulfoluna sp.]
MKYLMVAAMCLWISAAGVSLAGEEALDHTLVDGPLVFSWTVGDGALRVKLTGKTTGWVAVGFNPDKMMKGADFIMGYVKDGKVKVTDHFGNGERNHKADTRVGGRNDLTRTSGSEKEGVTEIFFTLPLKSGDPNDKELDPEAMTTVLLALGSGRDSFRSVHKFRSVHRVNLSSGVSEKVK